MRERHTQRKRNTHTERGTETDRQTHTCAVSSNHHGHNNTAELTRRERDFHANQWCGFNPQHEQVRGTRMRAICGQTQGALGKGDRAML